jgi:hypothetical protein
LLHYRLDGIRTTMRCWDSGCAEHRTRLVEQRGFDIRAPNIEGDNGRTVPEGRY